MNFVKSNLLTAGKIDYNALQDTLIRPAYYFNQKLLNFDQFLASATNYIFFARSVYGQCHLHSSINVYMHKIKPDTVKAKKVKSNFKGTVERFVASENSFSFISLKEHQQSRNSVLYHILNTHIFSDIVMCLSKMGRTSMYYQQIKQPGT